MAKIKTLITTLLAGVFMLIKTQATEHNLISHAANNDSNYEQTRHRLQRTEVENLTLPLEEELAILEELNQLDLGKFLLKNKGLNGQWTAYIIRKTPDQGYKNALEEWFFTHAPVIKATRERFQIFHENFQKYAPEGGVFASIPCGVMDDLLQLDKPNSRLVGIDLDEESLILASENAHHYGKQDVSAFIKKDAWHLNMDNQYNLITSNGLNIYEPEDSKVIELYTQFYKSLKPDGILITSFLTPPPNS